MGGCYERTLRVHVPNLYTLNLAQSTYPEEMGVDMDTLRKNPAFIEDSRAKFNLGFTVARIGLGVYLNPERTYLFGVPHCGFAIHIICLQVVSTAKVCYAMHVQYLLA